MKEKILGKDKIISMTAKNPEGKEYTPIAYSLRQQKISNYLHFIETILLVIFIFIVIVGVWRYYDAIKIANNRQFLTGLEEFIYDYLRMKAEGGVLCG